MWQHKYLGGQPDTSHRHSWEWGDSAAQRYNQQRGEETVLLWDHLPIPHAQRLRECERGKARGPGRQTGLQSRQLRLSGHWQPPLELLLHQHTHIRKRPDHLQGTDSMAFHPHQRRMCVCSQPEVLGGTTGALTVGGWLVTSEFWTKHTHFY